MTHIPSKTEILDWIAQNPTQTAKRDIARAFGIKGAARIDLKRVLRDLEDAGKLTKRKASYRDPEDLPPVSVLEVTGPDADGDLYARPLEFQGSGPVPHILLQLRDSDAALGAGDRILARLTKVAGEDHSHEGRLIRRIQTSATRVMGIFRAGAEGGRIQPIDKGADREWVVPAGATQDARDGELVEAEQVGPKGRMGLPKARILTRLGDPSGPRAVSLIAIHQHGIPDAFPQPVLDQAEAATPVTLGSRTDLRDLPLITIDPSDARDHDDACCVIPRGDGFVLWVAIADVAHYVTPGTPLDHEARNRGNSTYFPDRVVPMLPDTLSGDLCSLHKGVERPCIAVEMQIDADGNKTGHSFHRGLMRSPAALAYEEVQEAVDGAPNARCAPLLDDVIRPLYACYAALKAARERRQPLDLDLPERKIILSPEGEVTDVAFRDRLDAHRLIEEFMVLANVAAAETLIAKKTPLLFRVHEEPDRSKLDALRETAEAAGLTMAKGQVLKTAHLNRLLGQAADTDHAELINMATLRSMSQAYYAPENFGHFGLALRSYGHFTSPIRRYADLIVHRALITAHGWGDDGLSPQDIDMLAETGQAISTTERRSMVAERDTTDRYLAAFMADRVGTEIAGRISGIAKFGVFVRLDGSGADALAPLRDLGAEYYHYDRDAQTLMGSDTGRVIAVGQRVLAKLQEATPTTGGLIVDILEIDGDAVHKGPARGGHRGRGKPPKRKLSASKKKAAKVKAKVKRTRR